MSITALTWPPDSVSWQLFLPPLTGIFLYQGCVQFVQARYQARGHYARRALGKAGHMDVTHGETLAEFHSGLTFLIILVVIAHAAQVAIGVHMWQSLLFILSVNQSPWYEFREEIQCMIVGTLFILLGVMNFFETVRTLIEKCVRQREARRQLGASQTHTLSQPQSQSQQRVNAQSADTTPSPPAAEQPTNTQPPLPASEEAGGVSSNADGVRHRGAALA